MMAIVAALLLGVGVGYLIGRRRQLTPTELAELANQTAELVEQMERSTFARSISDRELYELAGEFAKRGDVADMRAYLAALELEP